MISPEGSLKDILPNEAPPKGNVYEIVQKIENFGTPNGGDAPTQERKNTNGKEFGSKVSSTLLPTKIITKINSHATMSLQSDQEEVKVIMEPKEVPLFQNSFSRKLSDIELSKPHTDLILCPAKIKYGSKEVIIKDGKAIDIDRNNCCAVQKHQKGLFALVSHQCVSTLEKYCSSMKKCFKKVVKKAKFKSKERHRPYLKKRKSLNQTGCVHTVNSREHSSKIEVTNLKVQRNTQYHICTHLDEVTEACSTEEESQSRHYIPKCRRDCRQRHKRISRKHLTYTPVYVMSSAESSINETSSIEETSSRVRSFSPIFESSNVGCVCGHHSTRKFKKSVKTRGSSGLYLVRIPDRSDSDSVLCLNERNICSRKIRHTKNYLMKQFKSHSRSFKMPRAWPKNIKKEPKIDEDSDEFYCDNDIVMKKPIRRTSKCLICEDYVKNKEKHYLNDPYVYSVTGINSVAGKKGSERSKSLKSSKNHSINCRCVKCKAHRPIYEEFTPPKYQGCVYKDYDEDGRSTNCYYSCKTKSGEDSHNARRINVCRFCKCEKCCCSEHQEVKNSRKVDFNETNLHKIVYAQKNSPYNSPNSTAKTSKSDIVALSRKKEDSNIVLCEYVHGSEIRSEVNIAHCSDENIDDLECSASLTMREEECPLYETLQTKSSTPKVGANTGSKRLILNKNHSSEDLTCTNLQIFTQNPHYDTT